MFTFRLVPLGMFSSVRLATLLCVLAGVVAFPFLSFAHEGHDHDDAARAALASSIYPRVVAQSELYELVGILRGDRLSIQLDHFVTNEPVIDAKLTVTIGAAAPVEAEPTGEGAYALGFPRLAQSGSVDIVFNIAAPHGDDLLVGLLALPPEATPGGAGRSTDSGPSGWLVSLPAPL